LVILLSVLALVSGLTGDLRAAAMMSVMVVLGVVLRFVQEARADTAAAKLKAMINVNANVIRDGTPREIPLAKLVPGDLVHLSAGGSHRGGWSAGTEKTSVSLAPALSEGRLWPWW
jgi:Mg2+-importing ATPase